jgi:IS30 family transposase
LTIIEINTRFAWVIPLKDKSADAVLQAFKDFLKDVKVTSISFDAGSEFNNKKVLDLFEENNIKVLSFNKKISPNATAIIERFNKTIRDKITKF